MKHTFIPRGVCSTKIEIEHDGERIEELKFTDGCNGNASGIAELVKGMKLTDVKERLGGLKCGRRSTSCPDQLSKAIDEILSSQE